ncbi:MAG: hypothetical protein E6I91_00355 [Chloroflexi bacterium]|nr:MAG: hypothetical protein E6I91_00355 [Chloroflexota bacterium]
MIIDLQLSNLPNLPQRETIVEVASNLWAHAEVVALWVGGSLASGAGDRFSDVDFRVAVAPDQLTCWKSPRFEQVFTQASVVGQGVSPFGDDALLHHLVLSNGEIFDFLVQSTTRLPTQEPLLILGCRSKDFERLLIRENCVPQVERQAVSGEVVQDLLVSFWINSHKHRKVLDRGLDLMATLGLHVEQGMLLRLWYIEASGWDCDDVRRQTIHSLTEIVRTIEQVLGPQALALIGASMRDRQELYQAIERNRQTVSQLGRRLAQHYGFAYPSALEATVLQGWQAFLTGQQREQHNASMPR